ncbi:MAG: nitrophenyl compound nitroreductase subunit ArsF family protein [Bacteroidota bacterium]
MKNLIVSIFAFIAFTLSAYNGKAQQNNSSSQINTIEVIQFHSEHRCMTCLKIEKLTRATLGNYFKSIPFKLVNVEDKNNAKITEQFEATGTALFLYNPKTGKKKDLTDFAFMKAGDEKKFEAELKKFIEDFIKS